MGRGVWARSDDRIGYLFTLAEAGRFAGRCPLADGLSTSRALLLASPLARALNYRRPGSWSVSARELFAHTESYSRYSFQSHKVRRHSWPVEAVANPQILIAFWESVKLHRPDLAPRENALKFLSLNNCCNGIIIRLIQP